MSERVSKQLVQLEPALPVLDNSLRRSALEVWLVLWRSEPLLRLGCLASIWEGSSELRQLDSRSLGDMHT